MFLRLRGFSFVISLHLQRISERAFDGLNTLRILNLQNNKISVLENGVFSTVPAVTTLNLNNNALEWLTYTTVLPIMDNLVNNTASVLSISGKRMLFLVSEIERKYSRIILYLDVMVTFKKKKTLNSR